MTKNRIIPYKPYLKELARELRQNSTIAEIMLWEQIKGRRLGFQFHRQVPMDHFIVDFYCHEMSKNIQRRNYSNRRMNIYREFHVTAKKQLYTHELMLAIEVDGFSHDNEEAVLFDQVRQIKLEKFGVKFLRFEDFYVKHSLEYVVKSIEDYIKRLVHPSSPRQLAGICYD